MVEATPLHGEGRLFESDRSYQEKKYTYDKKQNKTTKPKKKAQEFLRVIAMFFGCMNCSEKDYCCIDFHHKNPLDKEGDMHYMVRNKWSLDKIKKEVNKCSCLCSNCHRKLHKGRVNEEKLNVIDLHILDNLESLYLNLGFDKLKEMFYKG